MSMKSVLLTCALAVHAAPAIALSHESDDGHQPQGLRISLPGEAPKLSPESKLQDLIDIVISQVDKDDDYQLSSEEIEVAHKQATELGKCGESPGAKPHLIIPVTGFDPEKPGDAFDAIDANDDGQLSKGELGSALEATHGVIEEYLNDCAEATEGIQLLSQTTCDDAIGYQIVHELGNTTDNNALAITLPSGRKVGCFKISTDTENVIEMQIVEETDPPSDPAPVMWHSDDGADMLNELVLEEGTYHVEVLSASDESTPIRVVFVESSE